MFETLKSLIKQPYWVIALVLGAGLVLIPCLTIESLDKGYRWTVQPPSTFLPVYAGIVLLTVSIAAFVYSLFKDRTLAIAAADGTGVDLSRVRQVDGVLSTVVSGCQIRVVEGRIEDFAHKGAGIAVVLPCNEYFDDNCVDDTRSALGAFTHRAFDGQLPAFVALISAACQKRLGPGQAYQKTDEQRSMSFGPGRCLLVQEPLGQSMAVALMSTTTQRAGHGLSARISYLFDGMRELLACLADARITEVVMPVLGSGHGGLDPRWR